MCSISTLMLAKWHAAADIKVHERVLGGQKVKRDMEVNLPRSAQIVPPAGGYFLRRMEARLLNAKLGSVCERTKWMDPESRGIGGSGAVCWLRDLKVFFNSKARYVDGVKCACGAVAQRLNAVYGGRLAVSLLVRIGNTTPLPMSHKDFQKHQPACTAEKLRNPREAHPGAPCHAMRVMWVFLCLRWGGAGT
jgi:hypothetical protein